MIHYRIRPRLYLLLVHSFIHWLNNHQQRRLSNSFLVSWLDLMRDAVLFSIPLNSFADIADKFMCEPCHCHQSLCKLKGMIAMKSVNATNFSFIINTSANIFRLIKRSNNRGRVNGHGWQAAEVLNNIVDECLTISNCALKNQQITFIRL